MLSQLVTKITKWSSTNKKKLKLRSLQIAYKKSSKTKQYAGHVRTNIQFSRFFCYSFCISLLTCMKQKNDRLPNPNIFPSFNIFLHLSKTERNWTRYTIYKPLDPLIMFEYCAHACTTHISYTVEKCIFYKSVQ